ncbi:MAG TPA: serine protease [Verrucomicrobiae bacterium]|nr:serine protease [Verrucomicrobiae bacterium]
MKAMLSLFFAAAFANACVSGVISTLELNGNSYSNISKVYLSGSRVIVLYPGGGTSATVDKLPADFLESWGINQDQQAAVKAAGAEQEARNLERAIQQGSFRQVHGVVYDTRKAQAGWVIFRNVKVYQIVSEGALIDSTPGDDYSLVPIFVKHLPNTIGDQDYVTFVALPDGTFNYINKENDTRTVRSYDVGEACDRSEIPKTVLAGTKAFDALPTRGMPQTDVVAKLPESSDLEISGSGFFVSADGYFITNDHVVRNAQRVKLKLGSTVLPATVVREDSADDLALLKVQGQFKALGVSKADADLGQEVFTIGFPDIRLQGTEPKYTDGKVSSLAGLKDDPTEYQVSVPVQPGNSGGPLVDTAGNVRGVVVARLDDMAALRSVGSLPQNVNYAIKGNVLRDFLAQSPELKLPPESIATTGAVDLVRQAVAIVLVY